MGLSLICVEKRIVIYGAGGWDVGGGRCGGVAHHLLIFCGVYNGIQLDLTS